jgi:hypothetical protein
MKLYRRIAKRLVGVFVRLGLVEHPYGREYARERYSLTGRRLDEAESTAGRTGSPRPEHVALIVVSLVLLSVLTIGVLMVVV